MKLVKGILVIICMCSFLTVGSADVIAEGKTDVDMGVQAAG